MSPQSNRRSEAKPAKTSPKQAVETRVEETRGWFDSWVHTVRSFRQCTGRSPECSSSESVTYLLQTPLVHNYTTYNSTIEFYTDILRRRYSKSLTSDTPSSARQPSACGSPMRVMSSSSSGERSIWPSAVKDSRLALSVLQPYAGVRTIRSGRVRVFALFLAVSSRFRIKFCWKVSCVCAHLFGDRPPSSIIALPASLPAKRK